MNALAEHFFRHQYARLVASLVRRVGPQHLELAEDAAQSALVRALEVWVRGEVPANPSAWLFTAARRHLIGELRQRARRDRLLARIEPPDPAAPPGDDLLRMLFVCCDGALPVESQLVLALKVCAGFEAREIAHRLFIGEATVYKRLERARRRLREVPLPPDLAPAEIGRRLPAVRAVLYLLFTEGHLSTDAQIALRTELCDEAIRLATFLAENPAGAGPESSALVALMHLNRARMDARSDASGGLLLLAEQDRSQWAADHIALGLAWLARSADGDAFSRFHAEAGIAAEHCLAPSFAETRWDRIVELYALLERVAPSPLHRLNRAVAVAEVGGPQAGLAVIGEAPPPSWLAGSCQWYAVLADLHGRARNAESAARFRDLAYASAPSEAVRALIERRFSATCDCLRDVRPSRRQGAAGRGVS